MGNKFTKKKINEEDLNFLLENTDFKRDEIIQWHKKFMIDCPNGKLDKKEFKKVYRSFYVNGDSDHFCDNVFRVFDQDNNNAVGKKNLIVQIVFYSLIFSSFFLLFSFSSFNKQKKLN